MSEIDNVNPKFSDLFEKVKGELAERRDTPQVWDGSKTWNSTQNNHQVPHIDKINKVLVTPTGTSQDARAIVRHEIGHALWSPDSPKGGQYKNIRLALEDAIINSRWDALDLGLRAGDDMKRMYDDAIKRLATDDRIAAVLYAVASIGWQDLDGDPLLDTTPLSNEDRNFIGEFRAKVDNYVSTPVSGSDEKGRETLVKILVSYLKYVDKDEEEKNPPPTSKEQALEDGSKTAVEADGSVKNLEELEAKKEHEAKHGNTVPKQARKPRAKLSKRLKEGMKRAENAKEETQYKKNAELMQRKRSVAEFKKVNSAPLTESIAKYTPVVDEKTLMSPVDAHASGASPDFTIDKDFKSAVLPARWGACEIATPRLTEKDPSIRFLGRKDRPTDEGVVLRYPEREFTDGKIFGVRNVNKKGGGSIMLDWSGSMSLSSDQVYKLISDAPRKTKVACYSGSLTEGRIIVCADRGRYVDQKTLHALKAGGGNTVDGPALLWLTKNAKPRIWISDGHIFGTSSMPSKERHKILAQASTEAKVNIHRVRVVPMDLPLLTSFMATAQKYDIIRCENIFQAMLVLRQYLPRTSVIFEDTYTEHGLHVCRTQTARIAWRTFRQENAMKQWYVDLKKEINRHGQYADW